MVPRKQRSRSITKSSAAPLGGLNVRDSINSMPATDALQLVNWIPQQYGVRCRKGYSEWCIGMTNPVRSIFAYSPDRSTTQTIFAATDSNIYDVTTSTNAPAVSLALPGTTNYGRFTTEMMANSAGTFLLVTSELGGYKYYNGAAWVTPTFGGGAGQVSGVDPLNLVFVAMWKRRAWFIEKGTTHVWYSLVDSLTGAFAKFDVGPEFKHGGIVSFIANWTIDAGEGVDDFLVIGGENGDILIYKGTDPASATTFAIQGHWYVGRVPVGRRAFEQFGGDLLILSEAGLQPLSYVTRGGQSLLRTNSVDYLAKIQPAISEAVSATLDDRGWEVNFNQKESLLIIQQPAGVTANIKQFVLYTNTNKWCLFDGLPMICSASTPNGYYFGTDDGKVMLGLDGFFDAVPYGSTVGNGIAGLIQPAYSFFGYPGMEKQWHMVRPTFLSTDVPSVSLGMLADYGSNTTVSSPAYGSPAGALWDIALWDEATWGGALTTFKDWYAVAAIGYVGSVYMSTVCLGDTFLVQLDYMFEPGGPM